MQKTEYNNKEMLRMTIFELGKLYDRITNIVHEILCKKIVSKKVMFYSYLRTNIWASKQERWITAITGQHFTKLFSGDIQPT